MYGFVYMTTNLINGKRYIGQKSYSCKDFETYLGSGTLLLRAIDKYGRENFERVILEECETKEELNEKEVYYIAYYNAVERDDFYNLASGGEGLKNPSNEIRAKMSEAHLGKTASEETRQKMSNTRKGSGSYWYGKKLSDEHRRKLSENHADVSGVNNPNYGKHISEDVRQKISQTLTGRTQTEETKQKRAAKQCKRVLCLDLNIEFASIMEAATVLNIDGSAITKVCRGRLNRTGGHTFKYV